MKIEKENKRSNKRQKMKNEKEKKGKINRSQEI
jgi:hypothetical protein